MHSIDNSVDAVVAKEFGGQLWLRRKITTSCNESDSKSAQAFCPDVQLKYAAFGFP
jgi:hypothetical protein